MLEVKGISSKVEHQGCVGVYSEGQTYYSLPLNTNYKETKQGSFLGTKH